MLKKLVQLIRRILPKNNDVTPFTEGEDTAVHNYNSGNETNPLKAHSTATRNIHDVTSPHQQGDIITATTSNYSSVVLNPGSMSGSSRSASSNAHDNRVAAPENPESGESSNSPEDITAYQNMLAARRETEDLANRLRVSFQITEKVLDYLKRHLSPYIFPKIVKDIDSIHTIMFDSQSTPTDEDLNKIRKYLVSLKVTLDLLSSDVDHIGSGDVGVIEAMVNIINIALPNHRTVADYSTLLSALRELNNHNHDHDALTLHEIENESGTYHVAASAPSMPADVLHTHTGPATATNDEDFTIQPSITSQAISWQLDHLHRTTPNVLTVGSDSFNIHGSTYW